MEQPSLKFDYSNDRLTISGVSIDTDPFFVWNPEIERFFIWAELRKEIIIDFKFKGYDSTTSLYITRLVKNCEKLSGKKKVIINWYFLIVDEDMEFKGEVYQDMTKRCKFNLIGLPGLKIEV